MSAVTSFNIEIEEATLRQGRARVAIFGPSGCGKTFTMLLMLDAWAQVLKVPFIVIDTEHGTASKYVGTRIPGSEGREFSFKTIRVAKPYSPAHYIAAIRTAEAKGFKVCGIDSISHEWTGEGGAKQIADEAGARMGGNRWAGWSAATPQHNRFLETILASDMHVLCTMRAKTEWIQEGGKPKKVGLGPVQRENIEYEFDIAFQQDMDHSVEILKSRAVEIETGKRIANPDAELATKIMMWLQQGEPPQDVSLTVVPEDSHGSAPVEDATEEKAEGIKPATKTKITKLFKDLQDKHSDYSGLTDENGETQTWEQRMSARMVEWFETEEIGELSNEQGKQLIGKLQDTIVTLDRKKKEDADKGDLA